MMTLENNAGMLRLANDYLIHAIYSDRDRPREQERALRAARIKVDEAIALLRGVLDGPTN